MNVLFVTDPLAGLDAGVDASVGLMLAAQAEGHAVWACQPEHLEVLDGRVVARSVELALQRGVPGGDHRWVVPMPWAQPIRTRILDLGQEIDLVLLRVDPPVDARYLHTTYLLDLVEAAGTRVVNRPSGIRALHEKLVCQLWPDLCPPTLVSAQPERIRQFLAEHGTVVLKPVDGFAGTDVWRLRHDDSNAVALIESATRAGSRHAIAQSWLPAVDQGNKRLFLLDGRIIGAVVRRPGHDDFRIGPPVAGGVIDSADRRIESRLGPVLRAHGQALAGLDVIDGHLIEVNLTCPGGMHKTDALLGTRLSEDIMRELLDPSERTFPCHIPSAL